MSIQPLTTDSRCDCEHIKSETRCGHKAGSCASPARSLVIALGTSQRLCQTCATATHRDVETERLEANAIREALALVAKARTILSDRTAVDPGSVADKTLRLLNDAMLVTHRYHGHPICTCPGGPMHDGVEALHFSFCRIWGR